MILGTSVHVSTPIAFTGILTVMREWFVEQAVETELLSLNPDTTLF